MQCATPALGRKTLVAQLCRASDKPYGEVLG